MVLFNIAHPFLNGMPLQAHGVPLSGIKKNINIGRQQQNGVPSQNRQTAIWLFFLAYFLFYE